MKLGIDSPRARERSLAIGIAHRHTRSASKVLYRAAQDERLRLARTLHDNTSPYIANIDLGLRRLDRFVSSSEGHDQIALLRMYLDQMSNDLRWVMCELRPAGLGDFCLGVVLRGLAETWSRTSGISISVNVAGNESRYASDIEFTAFIFSREALANVAKHGDGATHVELDIQYEPDAISIRVTDDGPGCSIESMTTERLLEANKMGIVGMRERLHLVGGSLHVDTEPGMGTTLCARIECGARGQ